MPNRIHISFTDRDRAWAEWARWHLENAGHATELDSVDRAPGTNVVEAMNRAVRRDNPMLVLLSAAYLDPDRLTTDEWTARMAQRRSDPAAKLIALRVGNVDLSDGLWAPIAVPDVFDLSPDQAVVQLLDAVRRVVDPAPAGVSRAAPPAYPGRPNAGETGPRPPGSLPPVWNLTRRNPGFTGRDTMLNGLHDTLRGGSRVAVQALHGLGGVGKTQLALEYAHRFAGEYDIVWWIPAERPELIGDHLAMLAQDEQLRLVPAGTPTPDSMRALRAHLRQAGRWLLIFDNAEDRDHLAPWLPDGPGHLLITSRNPNWAGVAQPVDVDVFTRAESIALLRTSLADLDEDTADRLAGHLGDLPLAVGQALELLAETRMPVGAYLSDLAAHTAELMREGGPPAGYPLSLAATVSLTADRLRAADPAAGQLLTLCAHLGPAPIPTDLFTAHPDPLPKPLQKIARKPVAFARTLAQLGRFGLARLTDRGPVLHRLVQAVVRDTDPRPDVSRGIAERLLAAARPDDGKLPQWWPRWAVLLPHILAVDPATSDNPLLRQTANDAVWHLMARGEAGNALPLADHLHRAWTRRLGADDESTITIAATLAVVHRQLGDFERSSEIEQANLTRTRRLLGTDHPHTLNAANNLGRALYRAGEFERARRLDEDTLSRRRRVLGEDHLETLRTMWNLARDLYELGDVERAREIDEGLLVRLRDMHGDDHPDTLRASLALTRDLTRSGEHERARALGEDTFARRRRVFGDDHPDTLQAAAALARALSCCGEQEQARKLNEDTLSRRRRVLGDNHPDTLRSVGDLLMGHLHRAGMRDVVSVEPATGGLAALAGVAGRRDGPPVFVKAFAEVPDEDVFAAEAEGLAVLRESGGMATPEVILAGRELLVLSMLGPRPGSETFWEEFAHALAGMHLGTVHPRFGWHRDNWLGRRRQVNTWGDDGFAFFAEHRLLRWMMEPRVEAALGARDRAALERLCHRLPDLLPERPACLTHGDLWTQNLMATPDGRPALIDPAVSYMWAEVDLAHLWTTSPPPEAKRFFAVYAELTGLDDGWRERMPIIQLRQHLAVLAQFDDDWGAADLIRATLAPFRTSDQERHA